ncbi:aspartyl-phosphate phosphatase Spo0E family protein [Sporosarcina obsidiansis]|nr:aspartyl-phosphate phosphatase Spo0E family protein [Sporosarcina obsidiansis]
MKIERLRNQLIEVAQQEGMHSERTILLSRQLDLLINEYDKQKEEKSV